MLTERSSSPTSAPSVPEHEGELAFADGRTLSYATYGAPAGPLVVVLDGPGSRGLARAAAEAAGALGLRLVAPDRAGFGSTTAGGRGVADWPTDHAALLDALGATRAGIVAQSGGTPYACAAAASLPGRVAGLSVLGAMTPISDRETLRELGGFVRPGITLSRRAPWLLRLGLRSMARKAAKDPEKVARKAAESFPPADRAVVEDPALWAIHARCTAEILSRPDAVAREMALLARPWKVDFSAITAPVALWSGERDELHPTATSRRLAAHLGGAPVHVVPGAANFAMRAIYPDALRHAAGDLLPR